MTDEAYGPNPAAHPYVYTHQGNFPRIFTFLLYALGFRTVEAQIVITTFTVGLGTVYLIYHFFAKLWNPTFALFTSLVFISDYLLFAQWQVNTFKIWHAFFVFFSLICVYHSHENRGRIWSALLVLDFAAILYYDLMMAVFTFVLSLGYAGALYYTKGLKNILRIGLLQGIGAALGLGVLIFQLIAYYGWQGLKTDAYLTFVARNAAVASQIGLATFEEFFVKHKIVFWYNFIDGSAYAGLKPLIQSPFSYGFAIYTPYLAFLILVISLALITRFFRNNIYSLLSRIYSLFIRVNKIALFGVCALLIALAVPIWPSKILLSAAQILFILLLILPLAFPNRFSLRKLVPILAFCRKHRVYLFLVLLLAENILLFHTSQQPALWNRYSPEYVILLSALGAVAILFIYVLMRDDYQPRESKDTQAHGPAKESSPLRGLRNVGKTITNFGLYFFIGIFLVLATLSYRFELTTGWAAFLSEFVNIKADFPFLAVCILFATAFAVAATWYKAAFGSALNQPAYQDYREQLREKILLALFFAALFFFGWVQHKLYFLPQISLLPIWDYILSSWTVFHFTKIILILTVCIASIVIIYEPIGTTLEKERRGVINILIYFLCVAVAYTAGYFFSPGYTVVINLQRYSPLLTFFLAPLFGVTLYGLFLLATLRRQTPPTWGQLADLGGPVCLSDKVRTYGIPGAAGGLLVFLCLYWISVQAAYFQLLPPTYASFLKKLEKPPYKGASFVTNTYAAPTAVKTGQFAYIDPVFLGGGQYILDQDGYKKIGTNTYLWLADRDNPLYQYPQFAICYLIPNLGTALNKIDLVAKLGMPRVRIEDLDAPSPGLTKRLAIVPERNGCGALNVPFFGNNEQKSGEIRFTLRERDPSPLHNWDIVELESDYPPYLVPLTDGTNEHIRLSISRSKSAQVLGILYHYRQQQGRAENESHMKVQLVPTSKQVSYAADLVTLYDGPSRAELTLSRKLEGFVFVTLTPRSTTRQGRTYVSDAARIGEGAPRTSSD